MACWTELIWSYANEKEELVIIVVDMIFDPLFVFYSTFPSVRLVKARKIHLEIRWTRKNRFQSQEKTFLFFFTKQKAEKTNSPSEDFLSSWSLFNSMRRRKWPREFVFNPILFLFISLRRSQRKTKENFNVFLLSIRFLPSVFSLIELRRNFLSSSFNSTKTIHFEKFSLTFDVWLTFFLLLSFLFVSFFELLPLTSMRR